MLETVRLMQFQGKIEAAERNFVRILTATPHHIHARIGLGYCAWLKGDHAHARRVLHDAAALDLTDEDTILDCAAAFGHVGDHVSADALLASKLQTPRVFAARGALADQQGDSDGAARFYESALVAEAQPGEAAYQRLIALYRKVGRFDAALAVADRLAASDAGRSAAAAHARGQIFLAMGRSADAMIAFQAGLAADPGSEACLFALVRQWRRLGRQQEAEALLATAPETVAVLLERSDHALALRDAAAARRHAEAADRLLPKHSDAVLRLCRIEIDQGRYAEARSIADRLLGKGIGHCESHLRILIDIARAAEDDLEVKTLLAQLVALQPMDMPARIDLARTLRKLGDGEGAAAEVTRALDRDPRSLVALSEAGDQALRDRDYPTALGFYRRVLEIAPDQVHHHLRLFRLLQIMDSDEQTEVLNACVARFGDIVELRSDQVRRLRDAGLLQEALAAAEAALVFDPGSFTLWNDCFDLTLRLRPAAAAEQVLAAMPMQNRREEILIATHRARLAIRMHRRDEARRILDEALLRDPNNRAYLNDLFLLSLWRNDLPEAAKLQLHMANLAAAERRMTGATANVTQSHNGQIVNDMRLDMRAMAALDAAPAGRDDNRIRHLMQLVQARPNHIPTAQALVVTLTEAGRFVPPPLGAAIPGLHGPIPARVAQYWDEEQLPRDLAAYSATWRDINPDYEHRVFNDRTARAYLQAHLPPAVLQAYLRVRDATTRADLFRVAVLAVDGGIWADMDDRCMKPIGQLFRPEDRAVFWQERSGHICNNFMAAEPNHPILRRALSTAVTAINRGDNDKVWMLTGPGLITRCFAQEVAAAGDAWPSWLGQVNVIGEFDLWPVVAMHCMAVYKRQGRHWHVSAFQEAKEKQPPTPAGGTGQSLRAGG